MSQMTLLDAELQVFNTNGDLLFTADVVEAEMAVETFDEQFTSIPERITALKSWVLDTYGADLSMSMTWQFLQEVRKQYDQFEKKTDELSKSRNATESTLSS